MTDDPKIQDARLRGDVEEVIEWLQGVLTRETDEHGHILYTVGLLQTALRAPGKDVRS